LDPAAQWLNPTEASIRHEAGAILIQTPHLQLRIAFNPCRVELRDSKGKRLLAEPDAGGLYIDPAIPQAGGLRFSHAPGEHFYGIKAYPSLGPESHDTSLLRGGRVGRPSVYQCDASWGGAGGAPFTWTTRGYGLLVDSDGGFFTMGDDRLAFSYGFPGHPVETETERQSSKKSVSTAGYAWRKNAAHPCVYPRRNSLTYFLMVGPPENIFQSLMEITGRSKMFPKWAVGFTNSQWGIDQTELIDIVNGYRARNIPIDNFAIDFDWKAWGENNFGEFRWNGKKFAAALLPPTDPENLKNVMDRRQVKLTGIMKPRIIRCTVPGKLIPMTDQAQSALKAGVWYPGKTRMVDYVAQQYAVLINFNTPAGRKWYWEQTRRHGAMDGGLSGFWNDEADGFNNFFFMHMQQSLYEGQRERSDSRVWSLNRNFYLGSQRYGYGTWSGDIAPGFASMAHQALRMLSMVSLGQAKWSMDAGNWGPPTPEAYARWLQFAALVPIFRVHAPHKGTRLQPWLFGLPAQEVAVHAIRLRYSLAPYLYALERRLYDHGIGMVRPMMMAFPEDPRCVDLVDQWMLGDSLLAAPVLAPLGHRAGYSLTRSVYLPQGDWIDFFRGHRYSGNQQITYSLNAECWTDLPLFIREGSIIPMMAPVASLGSNPPECVYLNVFPSENRCFTEIYDDNGSTYAYEQGIQSRQRVEAKTEGTCCLVTVEPRQGPYDPTIRHLIIKIHGRAASHVTLNGRELAPVGAPGNLAWDYREMGWAVSRDVYGPATLIKMPAGCVAAQHIVAHGDAGHSPLGEIFNADDLFLAGETVDGMAVFGNAYSPCDTALGYIGGLQRAGASLTCYLQRPATGDYRAIFRVANGGATGTTASLCIYVNGEQRGMLNVQGRSSWTRWADVPLRIPLVAGNNILTLRHDGNASGNLLLSRITVGYEMVKHCEHRRD
jgi:alpha-glucosidase (family GH31 glycosyl hydrolase)